MAPPALFMRTWGAGAPVLFLHGLGASSRYWGPVEQMESDYRGIAPDLLGFGRSPKPSDSPYDVPNHLEALGPVIPRRCVVVGHSAGAILAAALAAAEPTRVGALLLLGVPAFPDVATARREVGRLGLLARLTVRRSPLARLLCEAMCRLRPLATAVAPLVVRDLPREIAADGTLHTWPSYHLTLERVVIEHRTLPDLLTTRAPVRMVHGASDRDAPLEFARALVESVRQERDDVELEVVEGDHHLAVRRPDIVANAVREALQAITD